MTTKEFLLSNWSLHPWGFALAGALVVIWGWRWRSHPEWGGARVGLIAASCTVLLLAVNSPLDALANGFLFSAHMLQHLVLLLVVPPLLLLCLPAESTRGSTSTARWRGLGLYRPALAWIAGVGAMWLWHVPALCSAATSSAELRAVQATSLVALGTVFWLPILGPSLTQRLPPLAGVLYLFTACVGCTLLGIAITFAPVSVCPAFTHPDTDSALLQLVRQEWGITPALDQQIGGLLMWVPGCLIYATGIVGLLTRWYAEGEVDVQTPPTVCGAEVLRTD